MKLKPINIYGETKKKGEYLVKKYAKTNNLKFAILRFFNVAGADSKNGLGSNKSYGSLMNNISKSILNKKKIFINEYKGFTGNKIGVRDYIHVKDLVRIQYKILKLLDKKNLILNLATGRGYDILKIIKIFEKISKTKIKILYKKSFFKELPISIGNNKKLLKLKLIKKFYKIEKICKDHFEYFKLL